MRISFGEKASVIAGTHLAFASALYLGGAALSSTKPI